MAAIKKLGNYTDNDIELCRTTSSRVGEKAVMALMEERIPFTRNSKKIPFFRREQYQGASEIHVITINPRRYSQARRVLDTLEQGYRSRLVLSNF